jgi:hypothetical protein
MPSRSADVTTDVTTILLGQFDDLECAERVAADLRLVGIAGDDIDQFILNAAGQHDQHPLGGDEDADGQARDGDEGAVAGAALGGAAGLAVGAAAVPIVGPLAALAGLAVGAYTGSLAGAVNTMGDDDDPPRPVVPPRRAGVRVAVQVSTPLYRARVLETFGRHDARSVEEAQGTWRNGAWADFDPVSTPQWVVPPAS